MSHGSFCVCPAPPGGIDPSSLVITANTFGLKGGQFLGVSMDSRENRFIVSSCSSGNSTPELEAKWHSPTCKHTIHTCKHTIHKCTHTHTFCTQSYRCKYACTHFNLLSLLKVCGHKFQDSNFFPETGGVCYISDRSLTNFRQLLPCFSNQSKNRIHNSYVVEEF